MILVLIFKYNFLKEILYVNLVENYRYFQKGNINSCRWNKCVVQSNHIVVVLLININKLVLVTRRIFYNTEINIINKNVDKFECFVYLGIKEPKFINCSF
jgi:hypothetical protein